MHVDVHYPTSASRFGLLEIARCTQIVGVITCDYVVKDSIVWHRVALPGCMIVSHRALNSEVHPLYPVPSRSEVDGTTSEVEHLLKSLISGQLEARILRPQ